MVIVRYSTKKILFKLGVDFAEVEKMNIIFTQLGRVVHKKCLDDLTTNGNTATLFLSQEETAEFYPKQDAFMTVRLKLASSLEVPNAWKFRISVEGCEDEEVL